MAIKTLKKYIFENNKIEFVLESINCHHVNFHPNKNFYSCGNYNGDNTGAVNVYNDEYLGVQNWTRPKEFGGMSDIITLTQYNKKMSFVDAVKYLYSILGLDYKPNWKKKNDEEQKFDPLWIFKRVKNRRNRRTEQDEIRVLKEEVLEEYAPLLHISWFKEGIMPWARDRFGICYSYKRKRIIIPHRFWLTGELVGINARTTVDNYEEFGIKKYFLTEGYNKSKNVYGYYENHDDIENIGYCVLFESEKSVLKRYSLNDPSGLALSGKNVSDEQARIISSLNVGEIVIAFDNDVEIDEIRHACEQFYRFRNVSYIYDKWDLLKGKQSPADASNKIYKFLFKHRTPYDESERKLYLESLNRKY